MSHLYSDDDYIRNGHKHEHPTKPGKKQSNYGWLGFFSLLLTIMLGTCGWYLLREGAATAFLSALADVGWTDDPGQDALPILVFAGVFMLATFISFIISVACAGAGLATNRGKAGSVLTYIIITVPVLYPVWNIYADFMLSL